VRGALSRRPLALKRQVDIRHTGVRAGVLLNQMEVSVDPFPRARAKGSSFYRIRLVQQCVARRSGTGLSLCGTSRPRHASVEMSER